MSKNTNAQPKNRLSLMGKKLGMTQVFDSEGRLIPCTLIEIQPNVIVQVKNDEKDGYQAIQLGFNEHSATKERTLKKRVNRPQLKKFEKIGVHPHRHLKETRVDDSNTFEVGQKIGVEAFENVGYVDIRGTSKGKGFQGLIKRNNYRGGPAAHGSGFHRHAGSTGMRSTPGRCLTNGPRPSQMGNKNCVVQGLRIISIDADNHLLVVKGAIPGANHGLVHIQPAIKRDHSKEVEGVKLWER